MTLRRILPIVFIFLCLPLWSMKLGYALSGGGARGYAHIGILRVLEEEGVKPDYIAGTSSGAVIGALYCMGYNTYEIEDIVSSMDWDNLFNDTYKRRDIYVGQKRWPPYGNIKLGMNESWKPLLPTSVFTANNANLELARVLADASSVTDFNDLPIPFACVATDLVSGDPIVFRRGSLMQAVRSSLSVPSIMKPFEVNGKPYIDGGVSQNLPIDQVRNMGADLVVGLKVNSDLRDKQELDSFVAVLDQTINIGMTRNVDKQLADTAIIFEPELSDYKASSFRNIKEIIREGEDYARAHLDEIKAIYAVLDHNDPEQDSIKRIQSYPISDIDVIGNQFISKAKVKEYLGLRSGEAYPIETIIESCRQVWNSQYFSTVYPVLKPNGHKFRLEIHVSELERRQLALNLSYTTEDDLVAGVVLSLNNLLLKNSTLISELKLGGKNELNLDYVKNFGDFHGVYYRVFPYINEKTTYIYDQDHYKTESVKSLEYGFTSGVGVLAQKIGVAEMFIYNSHTRLYRDISQTFPINQSYSIAGFGLKAYRETLDDFVFPRSGMRAMAKLDLSRFSPLTDENYNKISTNLELYHKYSKRFSVKLALEYGSYLDSGLSVPLDPFFLGGSDGYYGYDRYELSAPFYKIYEAGVVYSPRTNWFAGAGIQGLNYDDSDIWTLNQNIEYCAYGSLGYRSVLGPVKLILAFPFKGEFRSYLSVGYDLDIFKFSRR